MFTLWSSYTCSLQPGTTACLHCEATTLAHFILAPRRVYTVKLLHLLTPSWHHGVFTLWSYYTCSLYPGTTARLHCEATTLAHFILAPRRVYTVKLLHLLTSSWHHGMFTLWSSYTCSLHPGTTACLHCEAPTLAHSSLAPRRVYTVKLLHLLTSSWHHGMFTLWSSYTCSLHPGTTACLHCVAPTLAHSSLAPLRVYTVKLLHLLTSSWHHGMFTLWSSYTCSLHPGTTACLHSESPTRAHFILAPRRVNTVKLLHVLTSSWPHGMFTQWSCYTCSLHPGTTACLHSEAATRAHFILAPRRVNTVKLLHVLTSSWPHGMFTQWSCYTCSLHPGTTACLHSEAATRAHFILAPRRVYTVKLLYVFTSSWHHGMFTTTFTIWHTSLTTPL